jgi:hypothetical protein
MSLFPDLTSLTNEIKKFNATQHKIISLLEEIKNTEQQILVQLGGKATEKLESF